MAFRFTYNNDQRGKPERPTLSINPAIFHEAAMPYFKAPVEIATYSTMVKTTQEETTTNVSSDPNIQRYTVQEPYQRTLCPDRKQNCMVFSPQQLPYNLNNGFGTQIPKKSDNEFLSLLLECLVRANEIGLSEFVCLRNLLTKLAHTPYDITNSRFDNGMIVVVQKIAGVFYMFEFPTEAADAREAALTVRDKQMIYWGMKFESYVTAKPGQAAAPSQNPLDFNREFCSVVETKIGSHSLILRGEIDCCQKNGSYIELKTSKVFDHEGHERAFRRDKLIKWWLQSSLVGVKKVECGFRNESGIVERIESFNLSDLPAQMKERRPAACISFLDTFMSFIKSNVNTEFVPHVFRRNAGSSQFQMTLDEGGKNKFIPYWFADLVMGKTR